MMDIEWPTQLCKCRHEQQQHSEHGCLCGTLEFGGGMAFCQCAKFTALRP
jgi:hypothetical protein